MDDVRDLGRIDKREEEVVCWGVPSLRAWWNSRFFFRANPLHVYSESKTTSSSCAAVDGCFAQ